MRKNTLEMVSVVSSLLKTQLGVAQRFKRCDKASIPYKRFSA